MNTTPNNIQERFTTREAARIIGLSERRLRSWIRSGLITPQRGDGGRLTFSFQDLVVLRASKGLIDEQIPTLKIRRMLHALRRQLPPDKELTGLSVYADGDQLVVRDGTTRWQPDSGQFVLNFEPATSLRRMGRRPALALPRRGLRLTASQWFDLAAELEATSPEEAQTAYRQALTLDPTLGPAHVNLGQLAHVRADFRQAETHYREALCLDPDDALAAFNLGVVLEDTARPAEAERAYQRALAADPTMADAHYNLALLYERRGRRREALRHLNMHRRLTKRPGPPGTH